MKQLEGDEASTGLVGCCAIGLFSWFYLESNTVTKHLPPSKATRYTLQGLLAASVVGLGVAGVMMQVDSSNPVEAAQVQEAQKAEDLDLLTYSRVQSMRQRASLENKDLAALDLSGEQATAVLTRLVQWCETNEAAITQAQQAVTVAKRSLRDQQRLIRIGEASERQLADAGGKAQAVQDAEQAYDRLIESGTDYAMQSSGMATGTITNWQRAASLKDETPSDVRYLPGMDADRLERLASDAKRDRVRLEGALSYGEQQELKAIRERIQTRMPEVILSESLVLPPPEVLRGGELPPEEEQEREE